LVIKVIHGVRRSSAGGGAVSARTLARGFGSNLESK
jgi:hypothetical protein